MNVSLHLIRVSRYALRPDVAARFNISLAAAVTAAAPFVAFANLMLAHFYAHGSVLLDAGLFAGLLWRGDAALTMPASLGGGSFLATHVTLIFIPLTWLSRVLPLSMVEFFAVFAGLCHALLALGVFWPLVAVQKLRHGAKPWLACALALAFAFSGLPTAIALFPHFETLIPAFFLLFATALHERRFGLSIVFFAAGLATREDAGLHYAGVLALFVLLNLWRGEAWRSQRASVGFALTGVLYAIVALTAQRLLFHGGGAFTRVYLGDPPFAHVTTQMLAERIVFVFVARCYFTLPALAAAAWAVIARNGAIVLGYVASLPWLALNLLAANPVAGILAGYYAFPFLIGLGWPLLAARPGRATAPAFAALLTLSFLNVYSPWFENPGQLALPADFLAAPSRAERQATDAAIAALVAAHDKLGVLLVGQSVVALALFAFAKQEALQSTDGISPDTVVYLTSEFDSQKLSEKAQAMRFRYTAPGTNLHVASNLVDRI